MLPTTSNFRSIVSKKIPLIDVRAPVEFAKGAFPNTINLPLMNDEERHIVGIKYKQAGNAKAVELGHQLVSGKIKESRVNAWIEQIKAHPNSMIYCFRGGQRSQISQQWIKEAGYEITRLEGGYKAFRNYLIDINDTIIKNKKMIILGGHTGSGKTILLNRLKESIDLERLANHRGSSFGRYATPQPTQINFENSLAYALIEHDDAGYKRIILEDESRNIGRCYLPSAFFEQMSQSDVVLLESTLDERIDITYDEYIIASQKDYSQAQSEGIQEYSWIETMRFNFQRIKKRLGDKGYRELSAMLDSAWSHQEQTGDPTMHKEWIKRLLQEYYDPMYAYQIEKKSDRIIFRGSADEIYDYLQS